MNLRQVQQAFSSSNATFIRKGLFAAVESKFTDLAPQILSLLKNRKEASIVSLAVWALGRLGYREAIPDLLPLLNHHEEEVRLWTAWALGEFGNLNLEGPLKAAMKRERSEKVKRTIGGALKKIRFEPTRVFRGQIAKALRTPTAKDPQLQQVVEKLEGLQWPEDAEEIILFRSQIQQRDPDYFKTYMEWVRRLPTLRAALDDPKKSY